MNTGPITDSVVEREFDSHGILHKSTCPICDSPTYIIYKRKSRVTDYTSWEHESTMKVLGIDSIESQMRFCLSCFHLFHYPLFDERLISGEEGGRLREYLYEKKYNPGKIYRGGTLYETSWFKKNKEVFLYLSRIFLEVSRTSSKIESNKSLKILDWGGGDGYLVETISLISKKVLEVPCKAYCFDYDEWAADSYSPYFEYVSQGGLKKEAPFDIIFLAHVLEHVALPNDLLSKCLEHLSGNGIIVVYVPFQQYRALSPQSSLMDYHQQLFSVSSLRETLKRAGFGGIQAKLHHLSYRGNKGSHILAIARAGGRLAKMRIPWYFVDIYNFQNVLIRTIFRKIGELSARESRL